MRRVRRGGGGRHPPSGTVRIRWAQALVGAGAGQLATGDLATGHFSKRQYGPVPGREFTGNNLQS